MLAPIARKYKNRKRPVANTIGRKPLMSRARPMRTCAHQLMSILFGVVGYTPLLSRGKHMRIVKRKVNSDKQVIRGVNRQNQAQPALQKCQNQAMPQLQAANIGIQVKTNPRTSDPK